MPSHVSASARGPAVGSLPKGASHLVWLDLGTGEQKCQGQENRLLKSPAAFL